MGKSIGNEGASDGRMSYVVRALYADRKKNPFLDLSFGNSATDNNPQSMQLGWFELCDKFSKPDLNRGKLTSDEFHALDKNKRADKAIINREKNGEYFCAGTFSAGGGRTANNVESMACFVMDFDSGRTTGNVIETRLTDLQYFAYTSYSFKPSLEKWRVVIPYAKAIKPIDHEKIYHYFNDMVGGDLDPRCKTTAQIWYTPACPKDAGLQFQTIRGYGKFFDPQVVLKNRTNPIGKSSNQTKLTKTLEPALPAQQGNSGTAGGAPLVPALDRLRAALSYISADARDIWIKVGLAIHHDIGDEGRNIWLEWSATSSKFDEADAEKNWDSFSDRAEGPVVTLGTVYMLAKEGGWVDAVAPDFVAELNNSYFVAPVGGQTLIHHETTDPQFGTKRLIPMKAQDFKQKFSNRFCQADDGKPTRTTIATAWLEHPLRRSYEGIVFSPSKDIGGYYNQWRGFSVMPKAGTWALMKAHIRDVLCGGDKKIFDYVIKWMANCVQFPGKPAEVAIVVMGGRGAGKGTFVNAFGKLFGPHYKAISNPKHLVGNFNAHLEACVVLFLDEAFWAGDKTGEGVLKQLITEPQLMVERKHRDAQSVPNTLHIIMASNNSWVVPAGTDERRFLVLEANDSAKGNRDYFSALIKEKDDGGLEAMLFDLMETDLSKFDIREVPQTVGLQNQKLHSLSNFDNWWLDTLKEGKLGEFHSDWGRVPKHELHASYRMSVRCIGRTAHETKTELGMRLKGLLPDGFPKSIKPVKEASVPKLGSKQTERVPTYEFPPLDVCRKHFQKITGLDDSLWD